MKAFKPLPSNHQWVKKKILLLFKFLKLTEKKTIFTCSIMDNIILSHINYSLHLYMYILNICCSALSAGKGRGCQCNVNKTYYSKIYGLIVNLK